MRMRDDRELLLQAANEAGVNLVKRNRELEEQITELQKKCRAAEKLISETVECVDFMLEEYPSKTNGESLSIGAMQFDVWQQYYFLRKRARSFQKDYPKTE